MYLRISGVLGSQKQSGPQIAKKYMVRKLPHLRKVRKPKKKFVSPQIFGFMICGTYICRPPPFVFLYIFHLSYPYLSVLVNRAPEYLQYYKVRFF
jgi:hypothetical protein